MSRQKYHDHYVQIAQVQQTKASRRRKNATARKMLARVPDGMATALMTYGKQCADLRSANGWAGMGAGGTQDNYGGWRTNISSPFDSTKDYWELVEPSRAILDATTQLSRDLNTIMVGGMAKHARVLSPYGPGRLRSSTVAQAYAAMRHGRRPDDERYYVQRRSAYQPKTPIKVGVILDTSFSMESMSHLGAAVSWMVGEATRRVSGKSCLTLFGNDAWGLVAPGEHAPLIPHVKMVGGGHEAAAAYELVDAALDLADSDGARILFVFSDGSLYDDGIQDYLLEASERGVAVVWVTERKSSIGIRLPHDVQIVELRELLAREVSPQFSWGLSDHTVEAHEDKVYGLLASTVFEAMTAAIEGAREKQPKRRRSA